jgi:peptidoglycan/LPS O-acetylase OafA/YrhL
MEIGSEQVELASKEFRTDINGLRAWAVMAVILYHFGIPGFDGGFVGVDVFFVISGFLMTGIVARGLERGSFSFAGFYLARARRILPALIVLCAVLLLAGRFVLLPDEYRTLGGHVLYSLGFVSNIEFWQAAGYFDAASHEKWLLHTWSLSVEWQFYLILPVLLWAAAKLGRGHGRTALAWTAAAALLVSLALSVATTKSNPTAAFFLLHTRAWELLGGGMVYFAAASLSMTAPARRGLELAGLVAIVASIALFDRDSAWPGASALLPVAGAMAVLAANRSSLWTGSPLAQWLGDRSYSLYLWHWPVYVALAYVELRDDVSALAAAMLLTFMLGHLSYAWVEVPGRGWLGRVRPLPSTAALAALAAVAVLPALLVWAKQGVPGRFPEAVELAAAEARNANPRRAECMQRQGVSSPSCVFGGSQWKVIVAGDSHAAALVSSVVAAAGRPDAGVVQWTYSACVFVPGMIQVKKHKSSDGANCQGFNQWMLERLDSVRPEVPIVIAGRYARVAFGPVEDRHNVEIPEVRFSDLRYERTTPEFLAEFGRHVTDAACRLAKTRTVYMVRPIPEMTVNVPRYMSRRMAWGLDSEVSIPMAQYQRRNGWLLAAQDAAKERCGVRVLDPLPYLCRDGRCYASKDGRALYYDHGHLSEYGNKLLVPMFAEVYRSIGAPGIRLAIRPAD